jgi:predicted secreted hydrolase
MNNYREQFKPLKFPQDEQKHDHVIEWWYFNGNLKTADGRFFSYMNTLFATKPKLVKIPFLSKIPLKTLYFSHYLLTDNDQHEFSHRINPICLVDPNSFTKPLLWAHYDNSCLIEETSLFNYHIINDFVDLHLKSLKKPLLLNATGFFDLQVKTTYYYSLTHLETLGLIKVDGQWLKVEGLSWMDHQWAQGPLIRGDKWTWFSIQLDTGDDLVCFVYGEEIKTYHASLLTKDNQAKFTDQVFLKPSSLKYYSKETGSEYQLGFDLDLPEFNLQLRIIPINEKQEMIFGSINYWEGGIKVVGFQAGNKISGQGFMELVGTPMKKNVMRVYLNKYQQILRKPLKSLSQELARKMKAYQ